MSCIDSIVTFVCIDQGPLGFWLVSLSMNDSVDRNVSSLKFVGIMFLLMESLILAQDERWRRA